MSINKKIVKEIFGLTTFAFINFFFQFVFNWFIIYKVGPGIKTDTYFAATVVPQLILSVLSGSLGYVLVPIFSNLRGVKFYKEAWNFIQITGFFFITVILLLILLSSFWVPLLFPGFDKAAISETISFTKIQLISVFFSAILTVIWAVNNALQKFYIIEITSIIANLISLCLLVYLIDKCGLIGAAWISLLRIILQAIMLVFTLKRFRRLNIGSKVLKESFFRLKPLILGATYYKTDQLFDKYLASMAPIGIMTLLNFAQQMVNAVISILNRSIISPAIPKLSSNHYNFNKILNSRILLLLLISILPLFGLYIFGVPVLSLIPGVNKFTITQQKDLWLILICLSGFWAGNLMGGLTSSAFYSKNDTKTPTYLGVITFTFYVPLKFYAFYKWGVYGLCLSTSSFVLFNFIIQLLILKKRYNYAD